MGPVKVRSRAYDLRSELKEAELHLEAHYNSYVAAYSQRDKTSVFEPDFAARRAAAVARSGADRLVLFELRDEEKEQVLAGTLRLEVSDLDAFTLLPSEVKRELRELWDGEAAVAGLPLRLGYQFGHFKRHPRVELSLLNRVSAFTSASDALYVIATIDGIATKVGLSTYALTRLRSHEVFQGKPYYYWARVVPASTARATSRKKREHVLIVGSGAFGVSTALELARRGYRVTVLDAAREHWNRNSSNDVSKILRGDYGADALYAELFASAASEWQRMFTDEEEAANRLVHWTGIALVSQDPFPGEPTSFESESLRSARSAGTVRAEARSAREVRAMLPPFNPPGATTQYERGYVNAHAGWAESGLVLAWYIERAREAGATIRFDAAVRRVDASGLVELVSGERLRGDLVVVAAGAWTPEVLPETRAFLRPTGIPVMHVRPKSAEAAARWAEVPPVLCDVARTGFYVFPFHTKERVVKMGVHGNGYPLDLSRSGKSTNQLIQEIQLASTARETARFRRFCAAAFPDTLGEDAEMASYRICLYCDALKGGDFLMDFVPGTDRRVFVASGGSGHAFKFVPVLGKLVANALSGASSAEPDSVWERAKRRFSWSEHAAYAARTNVPKTEGARFRESPEEDRETQRIMAKL